MPQGQPAAGDFGTCRLRFQYGDLHFGQTLGSWSLSLGSHSCPHRSQRYPQSRTFGMPSPSRSYVPGRNIPLG